MTEKVGRNAPCLCGSGLKYKNCCMNKARTMPLYQKLLIGLIAVVMAVGVFRMFVSFRSRRKHVHVGLGPASLRATVSERARKPCRLDSLYD
jgi:hypothetical protein